MCCQRAVDINSGVVQICSLLLTALSSSHIKGNDLKQTQIVSRRQHKIPFEGGPMNRKPPFHCYCSMYANYLKCTPRVDLEHCGLKEQ